MSFQDHETGRPLNSKQGGGGYTNGFRQQDPTQAIASGIFQINTAISMFQRLVNTLGTPKDTPELRQKMHKTRLHIGQLVKDTSDKLKQASEIDHHVEVSASKKITYANFQGVLKEFQKAQRLAAERETTYTPLIRQAVLPSRYASNEAITEEREQGIQEIQNQIVEVNKILKDLVVLVHEQGARIEDIGSYIENSYATTTQSHLSKTQRANSSLTCLLLVIVATVICIVIIILAV